MPVIRTEDLLETSYTRRLTLADFGGVEGLAQSFPKLAGHPVLNPAIELVAGHFQATGPSVPAALAVPIHEAIRDTENPAIYRDAAECVLDSSHLLQAVGAPLALSSLAQGNQPSAHATPLEALRAADALEIAVQLRLRDFAKRWDLFACLDSYDPYIGESQGAVYPRAVLRAILACIEQWVGAEDLIVEVARRVAGLSNAHSGDAGITSIPAVRSSVALAALGDADVGLALARIETILALRASDKEESVQHLEDAIRFVSPALDEDSERPDIAIAADTAQLLLDLIDSGTIRDGSLVSRLQRNVREIVHLDPGRNQWVRDRLAATNSAWAQLSRQLAEVEKHFGEPSWYRAAAVIDDIVTLYATAGSARVYVLEADGNAIRSIIAPVLEQGFASKVALLRHLQDHVAWLQHLADSNVASKEQLDELRSASQLSEASIQLFEANRPKAQSPAQADETDTAGTENQLRQRVTQNVQRRQITQRFTLGSLVADELMERVLQGFSQSPDYEGDVEEATNLVAGLLIRFIWDRNQLGESEAPYLYSETAVEEDLAKDLHGFLRASGSLGSIKTEIRRVAGGRVDIEFAFPGFHIYVELKVDSTRIPVPQKSAYLRQAASYSVVDKKLGFLVVLKLLSAKKLLPPHLLDCLEVVEVLDSTGSARHVAALTLSGGRTKPSSM